MSQGEPSGVAATGPGPGHWPGMAPLTEEPEPGEFRHALRIGQRWLLVPLGAPAEVSAPLGCTRLPFTQGWCLGLASFRGDLVPIYDLALLWGEPTPATGGYFLIVGGRATRAGLRIDEIAGLQIPPDAATASPEPLPGLPAELAPGALRLGATVYTEVDLVTLLRILAEHASPLAAGSNQSRDQP